jgi:hypothetical protein
MRSPVTMTERGSSVLVWLERHPKPGTPRTRAAVTRRWKARVWQGLHLAGVAWLRRDGSDVDTRSPFGCVHRYEASWRASNYPYGGGLQLDQGFQRTYGGEYVELWGGAGYWPVWSQVVAAFRAHHGYAGYEPRGYTPWPNTARRCGLL